MAIIKCSECKKEVSDTSKKCIHCGAKVRKERPNKDKKANNKLMIILVIIGVFLIVGGTTSWYFLTKYEKQTNIRDNTKSQIEIISDYINIRSSKSVKSEILGKVYKGEIYTILDEDTESNYKWIKIETANGIKGFICGTDNYVKRLKLNDNKNEEKDVPVIDNKENDNKGDNQSANNSNNPDKNSNNNLKNNTNSNTNNNINDNNSGASNKNEEVKKCLKTCEAGYELKNGNSENCYCEKKEELYVVKNQVIYDYDGVKITAKGIDYRDRNFITLDLLTENNSDIPKVVQRNHFSYVNGFDMATGYSVSLQPGMKSSYGVSYLRSSLLKNGITKIDTIKIDFVIIDWDGDGSSMGKRRVKSDWIDLSF